MSQVPISPYETTLGMTYFPRMLDKIRKMEAGSLREDFHEMYGDGLDKRCCQFLHIDHEAVIEKVREGLNDEEILRWTFAQGRGELHPTEKRVWNEFLRKLGWNDVVTESLVSRKADAGLQERDDIQTMLEFMEIDEGRKA